MMLCLDIGNSTLAAGLWRQGRIVQRSSLEHGGKLTAEMAHVFLERFLGSLSVKRAALMTVVPQFGDEAEEAIRRLLNIKPFQATVHTLSFIKHSYRSSQRPGVDRLVNVLAASAIYRGPAVVVDIGTAITWDAVDERGRFLGGAIAPGPGTMAWALHHRAALLPETSLRPPARALGRNTEDCLRSGIYFGTAAMVQDLAARLVREIGGRPKKILTGGGAPLFIKILRDFRYDPDLTLKGLALAAGLAEGKGRL